VLLEDLLHTSLQREEPPDKALLEWDLERLYRAIDDRGNKAAAVRRQAASARRQPAAARTRTAQGRGARPTEEGAFQRPRTARGRPRAALAGASMRDLLPAADAEHPEAEAEQAREWRERITRAHAGDGVHSMLRALLADLPKVRTPWEQLLRTQLARGLSMQPELSWSRPSRSYIANQGRAERVRVAGRRHAHALGAGPGLVASAVARLAVLVDVSGSVEDGLMHRFAAELEAISRRLEAGVLVIAGDDRVRGALLRARPLNLRDIAFEGGGGTDFTPLLREAERHAPDMAVFLTDLDGPADTAPLPGALGRARRGRAHAAALRRKLVLPRPRGAGAAAETPRAIARLGAIGGKRPGRRRRCGRREPPPRPAAPPAGRCAPTPRRTAARSRPRSLGPPGEGGASSSRGRRGSRR
jgi:hypothetical protein